MCVCVRDADLLVAPLVGEQPRCGAAAGTETRSNGNNGDTWDADLVETCWTRAPAGGASTWQETERKAP